LDSLNNYNKNVLTKAEENKISKLKTIAIASFKSLDDIKCYLPIDKKDPPAVIVKWGKKPSNNKIKNEEEKIKVLVSTLMDFDTLILTSY
jgi:hypothetical protein